MCPGLVSEALLLAPALLDLSLALAFVFVLFLTRAGVSTRLGIGQILRWIFTVSQIVICQTGFWQDVQAHGANKRSCAWLAQGEGIVLKHWHTIDIGV